MNDKLDRSLENLSGWEKLQPKEMFLVDLQKDQLSAKSPQGGQAGVLENKVSDHILLESWTESGLHQEYTVYNVFLCDIAAVMKSCVV